jgi:hypothetical protein
LKSRLSHCLVIYRAEESRIRHPPCNRDAFFEQIGRSIA